MTTGQQILNRAMKDIGKRYVLGCFVPKDYPNWPGPFDCAEATSYWYYQTAKILFGTSNHANPKTADAWTWWWKSDAENPELGKLIPIADAAAIPGAAVLRLGTTQGMGHIVISDGLGGTVEAQGKNTGVVADTLAERRWSHGILVNGIEYKRNAPVVVPVPKFIYRLVSPAIRGKGVEAIQQALIRHDFNPGTVDGVYGGRTFAAVLEFQRVAGLLVDGEVGPQTWGKLGLGVMK